jgi:hypothetical protein
MFSQVNSKKALRIGVVTTLALGAMTYLTVPSSAADSVSLGKSTNYSVLAAGGFSNSGSSSVQGEFGLTSTISYLDTGTLSMNGAYHFGDASAKEAMTDAKAVYLSAQGQRSTGTIGPEIGGLTKVPGVYSNAAGLNLKGILTLDAKNDPNAVFIFQTAGTFVANSGAKVNLINSAQACNIFWQVGNSVTIESNSEIQGNILSNMGVKSYAGTTIFGRVFSIQGAISTVGTSIVKAPCTKASSDGKSGTTSTISIGSGEYAVSGDNAHFALNLKSRTVTGSVTYSGTTSWYIIGKWKFEGKLNAYSLANGTGITLGTGTLSYWGKDAKGKSPSKNGWIVATVAPTPVEIRFQTPAMNLKGTDRSTRVTAFAIGFDGAKVTDAPALPQMTALIPVKKIRE